MSSHPISQHQIPLGVHAAAMGALRSHARPALQGGRVGLARRWSAPPPAMVPVGGYYRGSYGCPFGAPSGFPSGSPYSYTGPYMYRVSGYGQCAPWFYGYNYGIPFGFGYGMPGSLHW